MLLAYKKRCGCTSNENTNQQETQLSGIWTGNVDMSAFGRENTSVIQLTFTGSNAELTLKDTQGSFTMSYTYTITGDTLKLTSAFDNPSEFPGQPPQNESHSWNDTMQPPINGTWPINGTRPPLNETWSMNSTTGPGNRTRPENGTWNPNVGPQTMPISFTFNFSDDRAVLYLNGAEFRKVE